VIRNARPSDLADVLSICKVSFARADRFGPRWLVNALADGATLRIDDGGASLVRGFALIQQRPAGVNWLRYVAVAADSRRRGVGRRLLAAVRGPAYAWVRCENAASRAMFAAAGWEAGIVPDGRRRGEWVRFHRD
jgi:GNAT superfamily N-acetyltransferase